MNFYAMTWHVELSGALYRYHLVLETPDANLSNGMRQLNSGHTQYVNRAQGRVGHLFQGRFKAILVERERDQLEPARDARCGAESRARRNAGGAGRLAVEQ
jgi:hypothetical protein